MTCSNSCHPFSLSPPPKRSIMRVTWVKAPPELAGSAMGCPWRTGPKHRKNPGRPACVRPRWPPPGEALRYRSFVDVLRVFQNRIDDLPLAIGKVALEEAAMTPRMAGDASLLLHLQQNHVVVAVHADFHHLLHVARLLALVPQLAPGTGPVDGLTGFGSPG